MKPVFLGWNAPLLRLTAEFLIDRHTKDGYLDMESVTLVLPGQRAINRLEEILATEAPPGWYPPEMITLESLPERFYEKRKRIASTMTQWFAWIKAVEKLENTDPGLLEHLLPKPPKTFRGKVDLGRMLAGLHYELAAEEKDFNKVAAIHEANGMIGETGRWRALAMLQKFYACDDPDEPGILDARNLWDPQAARLFAIEKQTGEERERILEKLAERMFYLVGLVDMNKLQKRILAKYPDHFTPLVFAPKGNAKGGKEIRSRFDEFGCLKADAWFDAPIEIDDKEIEIAWNPENQADAVMRKIASFKGRFAASEIVVGVPDREVVPFLQERFALPKIASRFFDGAAIRRTPVFLFLQLLGRFMEKRFYADYAELVRHPDVENFIRESIKPEPDAKGEQGDLTGEKKFRKDYLSQLDKYHNTIFPKTIDGHWKNESGYFDVLPHVWNCLEKSLGIPFSRKASEKRTWDRWLSIVDQIIGRLYQKHVIVDDENRAAVGIVTRTIKNMEAVAWPDEITFDEAIELLLTQIESKPISPPEASNAVELVGWLELAMDDAPVVIVTGMNDGFVPSFTASDRFLPDKLRHSLGVVDNRRHGARDAYAMNILMETRKRSGAQKPGRVLFIAGRRTVEGDAMRPSRFFFMSKDTKKAASRVREYFKEMGPQPAVRLQRKEPESPVARLPFLPATLPDLPEPVTSLSVTDFSSYVRCHYRFYLERLRKFKKVDDSAKELDYRDFGIVIHNLLEEFGRNESVRNSSSAEEIRECLDGILDVYLKNAFNNSPPASLAIQIDLIRNRLHRFADWQAERCAKDGYEIVAVEYVSEKAVTLGGVSLVGKIDRIDCRVTGEGKKEFTVIDYKTGDPQKIDNILNENEDWKDFQMPLYQYILEKSGYVAPGDTIELGYLMIPEDDKLLGLKRARWTPGDIENAQRRAVEIVGEIISMDWKTVTPTELDVNLDYDDFAYICMSGLES